jgi:magnesium transporter
MIVAHGVLAAGFAPADSVADAVAVAAAGDGVAWIAAEGASPAELEQLGRALGIREAELARVVERRDAPRTPRARVTRLGAGAHVIVLGWEAEPGGGARMRGQLELLATPTALAVLASDLPEPLRPPALLEAVCALRGEHAAAEEPLGLVLSRVLDYYEEVLDVLEDQAVAIVDELFVERSGEQLREISHLARPVHAATVATQPLVHGFEHLAGGAAADLVRAFSAPLRSELAYVAGRLARLDALLDSAQQTYFNLAQDEANRLTSAQSDITRKMSGYALLIAIPTIVFSLYGTNFNHVPLIGESWGYGVMLGFTLVLCLIAWRKLRTAGWL